MARLFYIEGPTDLAALPNKELIKGWYWRSIGGETHGPFNTPTQANDDAAKCGETFSL
jgi:hypothetical protein